MALSGKVASRKKIMGQKIVARLHGKNLLGTLDSREGIGPSGIAMHPIDSRDRSGLKSYQAFSNHGGSLHVFSSNPSRSSHLAILEGSPRKMCCKRAVRKGKLSISLIFTHNKVHFLYHQILLF